MAESGRFRVEVVSPERVLFSGDAKQVITRTLDGGEIAFLPGHISFLGALVENHTRIYLSDGKVQDLAVLKVDAPSCGHPLAENIAPLVARLA
ncbi:MAG: putative synthase subunit epsilon, partial [Actinomycetota bacterium]